MGKSLKKYLILTAIILPLGGFFILFYSFFGTKLARTTESTGGKIVEETKDLAPSAADAKENENIIPTETATATETATVAGIAAAAAPSPTRCAYPSQILNLANWKETLPTGSSRSPKEIKPAALASFSADPYFRPNATCDAVIFRAPVNGITTSGSGYPRSELREMTNNGKTLASWSTTSGTHSMFIDEAIMAVPQTKKNIVAGQIHDANDDVIVIRLEYPKLFVDINGKTGPVLDPNYALGKRFTVKFVASGGQIKIYYNGGADPAFTLNKKGSGYYFKAGAYTQSNCSKEEACNSSNYGEVAVYKLEIQN